MSNMKKFLLKGIVAAGLILAAGAADAAPLTPEQALRRAMSASGTGMKAAPAAAAMKLVYTGMAQAEAQPAYYVFNSDNGGFIIAGGDDVAAPVLGYSDSGSFNATEMPENLIWWLSEYAAQIEAARKAPAPGPDRYAIARTAKAPIAPMVKTLWNQSDPYNLRTPLVNGKHCPTGCSATALAQVMRYFKYPARGTGSNSYSWNNTRLSMDFSKVTFDWENMLHTYRGTTSDAQKEAVAVLMEACGISQDMNYGASSSGASILAPQPALVNYFGYAPSSTNYYRSWFHVEQWENMVYNSLADNSPVYYTGQGSNGGHAFVVDGYQGDGYFHLNWGWGGMSDGYFLLTALNPAALGIGGGSGGFNSTQTAILNIKPNFAGSVAQPLMGCEEGSTIKLSGSTLNFSGGIYNYGQDINVYVGYEFENAAGIVSHNTSSPSFTQLEYRYGWTSYSGTLPSLANGTYKVRPAFAVKQGSTVTWYRAFIPVGSTPYWILTVNGSSRTLTSPEAASQNFVVSDMVVNKTIYPGCYFQVKAKLTNPNELEKLGTIYVGFIEGKSVRYLSNAGYPADLAGKGTIDFQWEGTCPTDIATGSNNVCLLVLNGDGTCTLISERMPVTIAAKPSTYSMKLNSSSASVAEGNVVTLKMNLTCPTGYYANPITIVVYKDGTAQQQFDTPLQFFQAGETKDVTYSFPFILASPSTTYDAYFFYRNPSGDYTQLGSTSFVTTSGVNTAGADGGAFAITPNPAGDVAQVTAPDAITSVEVVSLQGSRCNVGAELQGASATLDLSSVRPGIYLVRVATAGNVRTLRLIRK